MADRLRIRSAAEADIAALVALDSYAPGDPHRAEEIAHWVRAGQCHLAERDGLPLGYLALTRSFFGRPFVDLLMVGAAARRQGVGRALMEHAKSLVPEGEPLWTSTQQSNWAMFDLLTEAGFLVTGAVERLDPGEVEVIFACFPPEPA